MTPRRVAVIGSGTCAGKTTFARKLGTKLGISVIEQDALFWGPGWTAPDRQEFRDRIVRALAGDAWVVDGNYGSVGGAQWERADTLVWLDIPLPVTVWRVIRRTLRRLITREELWSGNRETLGRTFGRDSLVLYALRTYARRKRAFEGRLHDGTWSHLTVHRFRSNTDADQWLASLGNEERVAPKSDPLSEISAT